MPNTVSDAKSYHYIQTDEKMQLLSSSLGPLGGYWVPALVAWAAHSLLLAPSVRLPNLRQVQAFQ